MIKKEKSYVLKFNQKEWKKYQTIIATSIDMVDLLTEKCKHDLQVIDGENCLSCDYKSKTVKKELKLIKKWMSISHALQMNSQVMVIHD